ncbi:MAG: GMP synthase subunit A [Thermoplasmata archaeon]|nr:GMP synthase subunit A [Thermoplasmata archaeon]
MRIPVIDNGGQWTHREYRVLKELDVESEILPNTTAFSEIRADGIVLSGGALSLEGSETTLGRVAEWIDSSDVPVLGICVGHQFLARHFGGSVAKTGAPEFGRVRLTVDAQDDPIFRGLPAAFDVWASHNDSVVRLPPGWKGLAHSASCPVQAMADPKRPIWGVQFHPEVEHTEGGREIFRHFIAACRR